MSMDAEAGDQIEVAAASLLHDIGHGPFSHTLEDVLGDLGVPFDHEVLTSRFISERDSEINAVLTSMDPGLPDRLSPFFDKKKRKLDHWKYKIVSSQMDADRFDYVIRDSMFAGLRGHGFDIERIFDLLAVHDGSSIAVHRGAIEAVESYLVTLDQLYRAIYYHKAVRSAAQMFSSALRRAVVLFQVGDKDIFPDISGRPHPLAELIKMGEKIELSMYRRLTDSTVWFSLDCWSEHKDVVLSFLSQSILRRELFKSIELPITSHSRITAAERKARDLVQKAYPEMEDAAEYLVILDEPTRTSYKGYDFGRDAFDESIWLIGEGRADSPLEATDESTIISALKSTRYYPRLIMPKKVKELFIES